jgi:hypothetical protein
MKASATAKKTADARGSCRTIDGRHQRTIPNVVGRFVVAPVRTPNGLWIM